MGVNRDDPLSACAGMMLGAGLMLVFWLLALVVWVTRP
jgi:hypothetical protein